MPPRKKAAPKTAHNKWPISDERAAEIKADVERWRPTLWVEEHPYGPACSCGHKVATPGRDGRCHLHPEGHPGHEEVLPDPSQDG